MRSIQTTLKDVSSSIVSVSFDVDATSGKPVIILYDNFDGGQNKWLDGVEVTISDDLNEGMNSFDPVMYGLNNRLMDLAKERHNYQTKCNVKLPPTKYPSIKDSLHPRYRYHIHNQTVMQYALQRITMSLLGYVEVESEDEEDSIDYIPEDVIQALSKDVFSYLKDEGAVASDLTEVLQVFDAMFDKIQGK